MKTTEEIIEIIQKLLEEMYKEFNQYIKKW